MTINAVSQSLSTTQRMLQTRTPATGFFSAFQEAYSRYAGATPPMAATTTASRADTNDYSVDLNRDGMEEKGEGRFIHFPPRDAPEAVVDAWNTATQDVDEGDLIAYAHIMYSYIHGIRIGDGPATGGMASDSIDSYRATVGNYLGMLERLRGQLPAGQYENSKPFFDKLRTLLG